MTNKRQPFIISSFFFFLYLGYGAFYPMIGIFLKEKQFSGLEMGVMMSITPLLLLVFQPMWGFITDYYQRPHLILTLTSVVAALILCLIPLTNRFFVILFLFILFSLFQSAISPLSDNLVVSYTQKKGKSYGNYRLWGAISFALAAWIMGEIGERITLNYIFYLYASALLIVALLSSKLPQAQLPPKQRTRLYRDLKVLFGLPSYRSFLLATFCILGSMLSNNNFFGLFYQFIGGTLAGVGICFLIGAGSEAPFMKVAGSWIKKYGQQSVLLSSAVLSAVKFLAYAFTPPIAWIPWITALQGFSIGLFIPASLQVAQQLAPVSLRNTAISIYSAVGYGFGNWFFIFFGGILLDYFPVTAVYWFFTGFTVLGIGLILIQRVQQRKMTEVEVHTINFNRQK